MQYLELDVSQLKRNSPFPYPLWKVFYCQGLSLQTGIHPIPKNYFEVCLRLESEAPVCNDIINGEEIHASYPHAVWKMPMEFTVPRDNCRRNVLAFIYHPKSLNSFRRAGLVPEASCLPFVMNTEIAFLTEKFIRLINDLYSPGVADQLDWLGFSLIKEVLLAGENRQEPQSMEQKIKNIALWLKNHCAEDLDFHALVKLYNLNYTQFYREWNRYIGMTPYQYVIQSRLEAAADLLKLTGLPVFKIIETVNFSGAYAFYRRFEQKYGMTPDQYRKNQHS